ncbi:MAG: NAD(P)/FAD-dependent oxidoreductase [Bacteroidetes bacterium]|jgi:thioredoxin reductase|nr:NAD(P)/FAD-dependent oxidoreductase [Bacteroidota bacterium]MDF1865435.1 NAD(P)/FAD-dependent oxidoreductase [Saprospiraceae bacterium]
MKSKILSNLIIGAGPAGLATAGRLRKMNIPFEILEQSDKIANAWHHHYDRLHLHTVNEFSHLPHMNFPEGFPIYVPKRELVKYYEYYATHYEIKPHFNQTVNSIKKSGDNWKVQTSSGQTFLAENVIIATGKNRVENKPKWKGQDQFRGDLVHSRNYKNPKPFLGQKVLVVGMGNTGAEIALDLSEFNVETYISVRSPVSIVPRDVNGRPVQITAKKMAKLPFGLGDWLGIQIRRFLIGDLTKYGLKTDPTPPAVLLRETGKTSVIDIGTVAAIKAGKIKVLPDIEGFYGSGIQFKNGEKIDFDTVILATGYHAQVEDFVENVSGLFDKNNLPKFPIGQGAQKGLFFVGFDNYKLGGILGTIYDDSETVAEAIQKNQ